MKNFFREIRKKRIPKAFGEIRRRLIDMRDESAIGANIVASNPVAQQILDPEIVPENLKSEDIANFYSALTDIRIAIANAKHRHHELASGHFKEFYNLVWEKFGDSRNWRMEYFDDNAVFKHLSQDVSLKFTFNPDSLVACILIMKAIRESVEEVDQLTRDKARVGVTSPSTNSDSARGLAEREFRQNLLAQIGLKLEDISEQVNRD